MLRIKFRENQQAEKASHARRRYAREGRRRHTKFTTPEKYEQCAITVETRSVELAQKASKSAARMNAADLTVEFLASAEAERECLGAMSA